MFKGAVSRDFDAFYLLDISVLALLSQLKTNFLLPSINIGFMNIVFKGGGSNFTLCLKVYKKWKSRIHCAFKKTVGFAGDLNGVCYDIFFMIRTHQGP